MLFKSLLLTASYASGALAAWGLTTTTASYVIDAGSANPLIVTVSRTNCDITSIKYRGTELQYQSTGSHIASGLGSGTTVTASVVNTDYIKVTCTTSTLTHYLMFKNADSTVYMATYITAEPSVGELRYIARLNSAVLTSEYPFGTASTTGGGTVVEGEDVFLVSGQTRSKFYSSERHIDDKIHCVYGGTDLMHVCMAIPQYESSTGGPFMRDINTNNGGSYTALYFYMNSGHLRTESDRMGLHGPYALTFSRSGIPSGTFDQSWIANMGLTGYVADSGRGTVTGTVSGVGSQHNRVVHWYNTAAQYWAYADSSNKYTSPLMKPGTYTMKLYQEEFPVATTTVSVAAAATRTVALAAATGSHSTIWLIGDIDGKPDGFLNADKQLRMHPSDSRMSSWSATTFTVGSSSTSSFPMALFKSVNNPVTIKFTLSSAISTSSTLRIGTTLSFAGGRPQATVNSWTGPAPAAPSNLNSRGVTRGAYRGLGEVYDVTIPAGTLVSGSNTITINVISGSSGDTYLSPNFVFDFVELFT